ncbi:hypothetical protein N824_26515 [Pedobacter sp. V48]|nr:hypothetical protein N824_26515 [Pedobacter sp. V48]
MAVQAASYFYTNSLVFRGIRKEIKSSRMAYLSTQDLINYQDLHFVMPRGHAFLKRTYNRALHIAFKIGDAN